MGVDGWVVFTYTQYSVIHCRSHSECSSNPNDTIDLEGVVLHTVFVTSRLHSQNQAQYSVALMNGWHTPCGIDRQTIRYST
jgi:hypothetical protein